MAGRPTAPGRERLRPVAAVLMAVTFGICAGFLDSGLIVFKKWVVNPEGYYRVARDFPWSVPASHAALMMIPGVALAVLSRLFPRMVTLRAGAWLLATLAIWGALLRMPIYVWCGLLLAAGVAAKISGTIAAVGLGSRPLRYAPAIAIGGLATLAAASSGWRALREDRSVAALPKPPGSRNVVLIVWDTVRARNLNLYKYTRETAPNLSRWADAGVAYYYAMAPAPWTFPSHGSFFTGRWPMELDAQWYPRLDGPDPTLAEYLSRRGYQTAAFLANTNSLTYETGLGRGFAHLEDYSTSPGSLLARTVPGSWLLRQALQLIGDYHGAKWINLQSRDAAGINAGFLDWLGRRRADRPFFACLNYFDAHDEYIPPADFVGRFGTRPAGRRDYEMIVNYISLNRSLLSFKDMLLISDCYDDCIAYLDDQLGRLLDELRRRGLLADTEVIITSDHGEAFGDHGLLGHGYSSHAEEIHVPLVILSPGAPAGKGILHPVSLRDLPATVVDRLGLADGSPFPGRSLAAYWGLPPGRQPTESTTPAFTEQVDRTARLRQRPDPEGRGAGGPGFEMSLVEWGLHYIRDGEGREWLYDVMNDPMEWQNQVAYPGRREVVEGFRARLLGLLDESPASPAVERAYLQAYKRSLEAQVRGRSAGHGGDLTRIGRGPAGPPRKPDS